MTSLRYPLALLSLGALAAASLPSRPARSQAAPAPSARPAPAGDDEVDVVEVGGAVRSLPRVSFVPSSAAAGDATRELARLVALTGLYATSTTAPGAAVGGLVVQVATGQDQDKRWVEATSSTGQGSPRRRLLTIDTARVALDQARLADAVVADLSGQRSHLSGTLLYVDASKTGERRVRVALGSGAPVRDVSPAGFLARGPDADALGKIHYAGGRQGEPLRLYVEGRDTPLPLALTGFVQSIAFAPDGRAALIAGEREGGALYVGKLDGAMSRRDTGGPVTLSPSFSADGQLAYATGPADGPLRVMVDGKPISPAGVWASAPSFCPRATTTGEPPRPRLAYMVKSGDGWSAVINELSGAGGRSVGPGMFPACSPDGRTVAVGRAARGKSRGGVWLTGEDGIASRRIIEGEVTSLRWWPGPALPPEG